MRVAVISDIHGNCVALDAVLADLRDRRVDQVACLGDAIQGGPQPAETTARLQDMACPIVMGNADAWLLTSEDTGAEPLREEQRVVREWSLARLSPEQRAFIGGFQPTITLDLGAGQRLLCFHGSPASFDDIVFPDTPSDEAARLLGQSGAQFLCGGHTHVQQIRRLGTALFFNPGSVGLAFGDRQSINNAGFDPWAEYAILTVGPEGGSSLEFRRVPFDVAALIRAYESSGRPHSAETIEQYSAAKG
jgi:predicted phosphodiesterase